MNEEKILVIKSELRRRAEIKFPNDEKRQNAYVWGTIRKIKEHQHEHYQ